MRNEHTGKLPSLIVICYFVIDQSGDENENPSGDRGAEPEIEAQQNQTRSETNFTSYDFQTSLPDFENY